ncbi:MAG: DNA-binding transcriptional regulator [Planctomycetaceae bacterium]
MPKGPRVAVLVETSTSWGTQLVRGIANYSHEQGPWFFYLEPRGRYERLRLPTDWDGDGIIARVTSQAMVDEITASGIPAVNVSWYDFGADSIARCTVDENRSGRMAAEHFLERGFIHFAYCGALRRPGYVDRFGQSFVDALSGAGHDCEVYRPRRSAHDPRAWLAQLTDLCSWLDGLPKPIGMLAWNDVRGRQVTEACQYADIAVPEEVAVLGAEDDELMCAVSSPSLSSIDMSGKRVGYEAARLLTRLMRGRRRPVRPVFIEPGGILRRQSTDTLAIDDPDLAVAVRFIREQAHMGIGVADVVRHVNLSRRVLEQRFKQLLGRLPGAEIRRIRIDQARHLLLETELAMSQIASACGFSRQEVFTRTFGRETGLTPTAYRKQVRVDGKAIQEKTLSQSKREIAHGS